MKNKILIFLTTLILCLGTASAAYAEEYGREYPDYLEYSGGAYIEVQSSLGRGTLVFQSIYKNNYFGFFGSGYNICNISSGTISGTFILTNGKEYSCRFSSMNTMQYYYNSGIDREWRDVIISEIYNTNVTFVDDTDLERSNIIDLFDEDPFSYIVIALLLVITLAVPFLLLLFRS